MWWLEEGEGISNETIVNALGRCCRRDGKLPASSRNLESRCAKCCGGQQSEGGCSRCSDRGDQGLSCAVAVGGYSWLIPRVEVRESVVENEGRGSREGVMSLWVAGGAPRLTEWQ